MSQLLNYNSYFRVYAEEVDANIMKVAGVNVGDALQTLQEEIDTLQPANVDAITQSILFPTVDTFSSQPLQITPDGDVPTNKCELSVDFGSSIGFKNEDEELNGKIYSTSSQPNTLILNAGGDASGDINFECSTIKVNGVPIGTNNALEQTLQIPPYNTFTGGVPITISDINNNSAYFDLNNGGTLRFISQDGSSTSQQWLDNSGSLNTSGVISKTSQDVEDEHAKGCQSTFLDATNSTICSIENLDGDLKMASSTGKVTLYGTSLLFNDLPVGGGGNVALSEAISVPAQGTFSSAPIEITSIDNVSGNVILKTGSVLVCNDVDNTTSGTIAKEFNKLVINSADALDLVSASVLTLNGSDNVNVVSVSGNGAFSVGGQLDLTGATGINLTSSGGNVSIGSDSGYTSLGGSSGVNISNDTTLKDGSILTINNSDNSRYSQIQNISDGGFNYCNITGQDRVKLVNSKLYVNKGSRNLTLEIEDLYGTASFKGAGTYEYDSTLLIQGGDGFIIRRNGVDVNIRPNAGDGEISTTGAKYNFLNADVYNKGVKLQPCAGGSTRPASPQLYEMYFDTSLIPKPAPIWWDGSNWVDYKGDSV